jgi:hypothetical protein
MPRRDRTFTYRDVVRIYCNNLDPDERNEVLRRFRGPSELICREATEEEEDTCLEVVDALRTLLRDVEIASEFVEVLLRIYARHISQVLRRVPIIGPKVADNLLKIIEQLDFYLKAVLEAGYALLDTLELFCKSYSRSDSP